MSFDRLRHWVAAPEPRFSFGAISGIFWLKATVLTAFSLGLGISSPLWIGPRSYPLVPALPAMPTLGHPLDEAAYCALFLLAAAALISRRPQKLIGAFLALLLVFCLLDQTRWQPWVFLYSALLVTLATFSWDPADEKGRLRALNTARLIIAGTYFFSGLQKFNWNFVAHEFPGLAQPIADRFPDLSGAVHTAALAAPFIQTGFAVGLLTRRFRRLSLIIAIAMHVFILTMLGPLGQNWNVVVWPWTAAMAIIDLLLFGPAETWRWNDVLLPGPAWWPRLALVLFVIMPFFSFVNIWDSYLSAALYSGNLTEGAIYIDDAGRASLSGSITRYIAHSSVNTNVLNLQRWAIEDLNVTPYAESRIYRGIAANLCGQIPGGGIHLVLILREQRMFFSNPETGYRCDQL